MRRALLTLEIWSNVFGYYADVILNLINLYLLYKCSPPLGGLFIGFVLFRVIVQSAFDRLSWFHFLLYLTDLMVLYASARRMLHPAMIYASATALDETVTSHGRNGVVEMEVDEETPTAPRRVSRISVVEIANSFPKQFSVMSTRRASTWRQNVPLPRNHIDYVEPEDDGLPDLNAASIAQVKTSLASIQSFAGSVSSFMTPMPADALTYEEQSFGWLLLLFIVFGSS